MPVRIQRFASMFWTIYGQVKTPDGFVRTSEQTPALQKETYARIFHSLLNQGFYQAPSGYEVSFLSTAHTESELEGFVAGFEKALRQ